MRDFEEDEQGYRHIPAWLTIGSLVILLFVGYFFGMGLQILAESFLGR